MSREGKMQPIFGDKEHAFFTAEVLAGNVNLGEWLHPYNAGDILIPLVHLGDEIRNIVQDIMKIRNEWDGEVMERKGVLFQEQYNYSLEEKIVRYRNQCLAKEEIDYNPKHVPVLTYQQWLFDEPNPFQYLSFQWAEGKLGKYAELVVARILNGTIIDLDGILPDIAVQTREGTIYIESKAARFSSREKYLTPGGTMRPVSRNGFFAKRNQIHSSLDTEINSPETTTYMALVDYDLIGGENMTFTEFTKARPEVFGRIQWHQDIKSLPEKLRDTIVIKSILLIPTWAAFMNWNAHILRTRPLDKFREGRLYENESHPVAQYFETKHIRFMKEYLIKKWIPRNTHTVSWIQETPIQIETFGHQFLSFESIDLR